MPPQAAGVNTMRRPEPVIGILLAAVVALPAA
jgi:hypothetical protein